MRANEPRGLAEHEYQRFVELVRRKSGIVLPETRRPELARVVWQMSDELQLTSAMALYNQLVDEKRGRMLQESLLARLTVGETYFFRNRPQFEALEGHILPALIARRAATQTLRVWSAGCASGEEPYSLAILLQRLLPDLAAWNVLILATDINRELLERGRRGIYGDWSFRNGAADLQPHYFTRRADKFEINSSIRRLVQFEYLNLAEDGYPSAHGNTNQMDLILCRNVLIYFENALVRKVAGRLHEALADGGWLIVGHAEPSQTIFYQFTRHSFPGTVVYQKANPAPPPAAGLNSAAAPLPAVEPAARSAPPESGRTPPPAAPTIASALALLAQGKEMEAVNALQLLAAAQPDDPQAPCLLAKFYANRQQLGEAEEWAQAALRRAPLHPQAHYLHALILQEGGHSWEALEALRRCIYADPRYVLAHFALAGQFTKLAQPLRARKSLENVMELLSGRARDELIPEGDGMTVGRMRELVATFQQASHEQR